MSTVEEIEHAVEELPPPDFARFAAWVERKRTEDWDRQIEGDAKANRKKLDYPLETEGSRIAAQLRKDASKLTAEQRRELFRRAMVRIYGGEPKAFGHR